LGTLVTEAILGVVEVKGIRTRGNASWVPVRAWKTPRGLEAMSEDRSKSPRCGYARQIFWLPGSYNDLVPIELLGMFR